MNNLSLVFLPGWSLSLRSTWFQTPPCHWPLSNQAGGASLGAVLHLPPPVPTHEVLSGDSTGEFHLLECREPELGCYRILRGTPLTVECVVGSTPARAVDTVLRLCMFLWVFARGGLLLHATALARGQAAVVGIAPSGGGKSTLTDLAQNSGIESLSDETVAILPVSGDDRTVDGRHDGYEVWGTPFRSSAVQKPLLKRLPLQAALLLEKSTYPQILHADRQALLRSLLEQAYLVPHRASAYPDLFRRAARLASTIPAFRFRFPKKLEAAHLLDELFDTTEQHAAAGDP